jgi:hypothetical protein
MAYERFDHGPLETYEIVWNSGHVEQVRCHQVSLPAQGIFAMSGGLTFGPSQPAARRITIHGEISGKWRLILDAPEEDIRSIRLITTPERIPDEAVPS